MRLDRPAVLTPFIPGQMRLQPALIVLQGLERGESVIIQEKPLTIGWGEDCDFVISDDGISRTHAQVFRNKDGHCVIEDLGSINGIHVGSDRVGSYVMREGDKLLLGRHTILRFMMIDSLDERYHSQMYESAVKDGLTGVFNRRYFDDLLRNEISFSIRHQTSLSILLLDIDHFKSINDTHGHLIGDAVLQEIARVIQATLREEDMMARYGGEEFVLLARSMQMDGTKAFGERIRRVIQDTRILTPEGIRVPVTVSIGAVTFYGEATVSGPELLRVAYNHLYQAKESGRNRLGAALLQSPQSLAISGLYES